MKISKEAVTRAKNDNGCRKSMEKGLNQLRSFRKGISKGRFCFQEYMSIQKKRNKKLEKQEHRVIKILRRKCAC